MPRTVCLDFDGVCNRYTGWRGEDDLCEPQGNLGDFIAALKSYKFEVVVHSTRPSEKIVAWLNKHEIVGVDRVVDRKPPAYVYLDDRAVLFSGDFCRALENILAFRPYWEADRTTPSGLEYSTPGAGDKK